jgi:hypothetical protein
MKQLTAITLSLIFTGLATPFAKGESPPVSTPVKPPYQVSVLSGDATSVIPADLIHIDLGNGKKITIDLKQNCCEELSIIAGDYPPAIDDPEWHSLVIYPGAANVIRVGVDSHEKDNE